MLGRIEGDSDAARVEAAEEGADVPESGGLEDEHAAALRAGALEGRGQGTRGSVQLAEREARLLASFGFRRQEPVRLPSRPELHLAACSFDPAFYIGRKRFHRASIPLGPSTRPTLDDLYRSALSPLLQKHLHARFLEFGLRRNTLAAW